VRAINTTMAKKEEYELWGEEHEAIY
jgi:hypothetical protein